MTRALLFLACLLAGCDLGDRLDAELGDRCRDVALLHGGSCPWSSQTLANEGGVAICRCPRDAADGGAR